MKILSEAEMAAKLDYAHPMDASPPVLPPYSIWRVPFEYGGNAKGTRISVALAKTIAAELRMEVAIAEKEDLMEAFQAEKRRVQMLEQRLSASEEASRHLSEMIRRKKRPTAR